MNVITDFIKQSFMNASQLLSDVFQFVNDIVDNIFSMSAEQIALTSIAVSLVIYLLSRSREQKLKKYEAKKEKYEVFIEFMVKFFSHSKDINEGKIDFVENLESDYYKLGANLAIYGSKRLYREYCFFRRITTDESIQKNKYYDDYLVILSFAKMFKLIRREAGLNMDMLSESKILMFIINDIQKAELVKKYRENQYKKIMLKYQIFLSNLKYNSLLSSIKNLYIKPIIVIPLLTIGLILLNVFWNFPRWIWRKIRKNKK